MEFKSSWTGFDSTRWASEWETGGLNISTLDVISSHEMYCSSWGNEMASTYSSEPNTKEMSLAETAEAELDRLLYSLQEGESTNISGIYSESITECGALGLPSEMAASTIEPKATEMSTADAELDKLLYSLQEGESRRFSGIYNESVTDCGAQGSPWPTYDPNICYPSVYLDSQVGPQNEAAYKQDKDREINSVKRKMQESCAQGLPCRTWPTDAPNIYSPSFDLHCQAGPQNVDSNQDKILEIDYLRNLQDSWAQGSPSEMAISTNEPKALLLAESAEAELDQLLSSLQERESANFSGDYSESVTDCGTQGLPCTTWSTYDPNFYCPSVNRDCQVGPQIEADPKHDKSLEMNCARRKMLDSCDKGSLCITLSSYDPDVYFPPMELDLPVGPQKEAGRKQIKGLEKKHEKRDRGEHNLKERQRRTMINDNFASIRMAVPGIPEKASVSTVLAKVPQYVKELQHLEQLALNEIEEEKAKQKQLLSILKRKTAELKNKSV